MIEVHAEKAGVEVRYPGAEGKETVGRLHLPPDDLPAPSPLVDARKLGMKLGETKTVTLPPEKGYGSHRDDLLITMDRKELPPDLNPVVGQRLEFSKDKQRLQFTVAEVSDDAVVFDANHPLAGKTLNFELLLLEIEGEGEGKGE